jgi:hypothetical protein
VAIVVEIGNTQRARSTCRARGATQASKEGLVRRNADHHGSTNRDERSRAKGRLQSYLEAVPSLGCRPDRRLSWAQGSFASLIVLLSARDCRIKFRSCWRSSKASLVYRPCFSAFLLAGGAPEPAAPPCIRQRFFPRTAGDIHGFPDRVFAPQRGPCNIGPVLRSWLTMAVPPAPQRCRLRLSRAPITERGRSAMNGATAAASFSPECCAGRARLSDIACASLLMDRFRAAGAPAFSSVVLTVTLLCVASLAAEP